MPHLKSYEGRKKEEQDKCTTSNHLLKCKDNKNIVALLTKIQTEIVEAMENLPLHSQ